MSLRRFRTSRKWNGFSTRQVPELPDADRFTVVPCLVERVGSAPVLVVTERDECVNVERAVAAGARGYALKTISPDGFGHALATVIAGHLFLQSELSAVLYELGSGAGRDSDASGAQGLTAAETRLLALIASGYTNQEAARMETVSLRTIEGRRARLRTKLGCDNRAGLTRAAQEMGLGYGTVTA